MLIGPSVRPGGFDTTPDQADIKSIVAFIHQLDKSLRAIVLNSVGLIGVRGLSTSGTPSNNFAFSLGIGRQTSVSWNFPQPEQDPSYMITYSISQTSGVVMTSMLRTASNVTFTFVQPGPTGAIMDILLVR